MVRLLFVATQELDAEHILIEAELAVKFACGCGSRLHIDDDVNAFRVLVNVISKLPAAPNIDLFQFAALIGDNLEQLLNVGRQITFVNVRRRMIIISYSRMSTHLLWSKRPRSVRGRRVMR